ncbi:DUF1573 domain-containing protein [Daejeonella oryzae]|uniref:DUF1573 domain-containing protein n=1 Tax=Daejeonella oryzae TaxID=1122943 RepID=UPI00040DB4FD|nr:DUF1573 domain-containing protein [Daejeonella oryzae]
MKKFFTLCAVVIGFIAFTAMQTDNKAVFKFEKETHDFGKIPQGKPVSFEFKFTNSGEEPLIISNVESTCGCTVPVYTKTPILKGQSGIITVTFNAASAQAFSKAVTIKSNARTPVKLLYIKGEVVAN